MSLRIRHLRIRAQTTQGLFGVDIPFEDGLVLLRADNSMGKSTAVRSLIYALGLERMTSTHPTQALTAALHDRLIFDADTMNETPVLEAWITLQIEGSGARPATLTRWAKHADLDAALVRVEMGAALTSPGAYPTTDYFVGRAGAAANPRGFHRWLAEFIGWDLPSYPAPDGKLVPLYMEQIFPLLFVEQKRGWQAIQAQTPYFSGVTDVRRRAIEFLLGLEVGQVEFQKQRLRAELGSIQESWRSAVTAFRGQLDGTGLVTTRLPATPRLSWPQELPPLLVENRGQTWIPLDQVVGELRHLLAELETRPVQVVGQIADAAEDRLSAAQESLEKARESQADLAEGLRRERDGLRGIQERITALRDDLREHQDVLTLQRLGSDELGRLHGDCPVCHQRLPESLLGTEQQVSIQSPEETVQYLKLQLQLFETMERDANRTLDAKKAHWAGLQDFMRTTRAEIRTLQQTLTSSNSTMSTDDVAQRIRLGDRIDRLQRIDEKFLELLASLDGLADRARSATSGLRELPDDRLSPTDLRKLELLRQSFVRQLHSYGFGSFADANLRIAEEDYLPHRDQFDLQADISASDSIRVIWAYLVGLLEVSQRESTNHPGLVLFDEPRQQSANTVSFEALLRHAGSQGVDTQILFATSEDLSLLQNMLEGVDHSMHAIEGYVLKPVV
jgi:phage shock protein A